MTDCFEVAIEIRHDAELVALPQFLQYGAVAYESGGCFGQKSSGYPCAARAASPVRFLSSPGAVRKLKVEIGNQRMHRSSEIGVVRQVSDEGRIGGETTGLEGSRR